jgi:hypothetical protein
MFSFPVTRLNALMSSLLTLLSARALIRCTVAISSSTSVSVISGVEEHRNEKWR